MARARLTPFTQNSSGPCHTGRVLEMMPHPRLGEGRSRGSRRTAGPMRQSRSKLALVKGTPMTQGALLVAVLLAMAVAWASSAAAVDIPTAVSADLEYLKVLVARDPDKDARASISKGNLDFLGVRGFSTRDQIDLETERL